ncbi:unnamed protein product [Ilex paraguariensis]|uniref:Transcription factor MYB1R1 n=1 Tax=Ilex paraguariensis TaxID=185542 RepID=A0ABC8T6Z5_9AQUA
MSPTCGKDGQYSHACPEASGGAASATTGKGFMLFGVRVMEMEGSFRKSASMTNLAQYDHEQPQDSNVDVAAGYASDDVVHTSARCRERKRGVPWTEEEHKLFLLGLQKVGKGDWRGISRTFVKTRTPTQVASHAQKYFLRRNNHNRRRRRSSLFDITTDMFLSSVLEDQVHQETISQPPLQPPHLSNNIQVEGFRVSTFPETLSATVLPVTGENSMESLTLGQSNQVKKSPNPIRPIPILPVPPSSKMADLSLNQTHTPTTDPLPLSLNLSTTPSSPSDQQSPPAKHGSAFQAMSGSFNSSSSNGDSIISVA